MTNPHPPDDHAFVHENLAAFLADGLDPAERARFDAHINACPACFDAFTEARDADRALLRTLAPLAPSLDLEKKLIKTFREKTMTTRQLFLRKSGYAAAAAIALAATGVFANFAIHQTTLNNPMTAKLVDEAGAGLPMPLERMLGTVWKSTRSRGAVSDTFNFNYSEAPASKIIEDVARNFGLAADIPPGVSGRITASSRGPINKQQSLSLLDDVLYPMGYSLKISPTDQKDQEVLKVESIAEAKKVLTEEQTAQRTGRFYSTKDARANESKLDADKALKSTQLGGGIVAGFAVKAGETAQRSSEGDVKLGIIAGKPVVASGNGLLLGTNTYNGGTAVAAGQPSAPAELLVRGLPVADARGATFDMRARRLDDATPAQNVGQNLAMGEARAETARVTVANGPTNSVDLFRRQSGAGAASASNETAAELASTDAPKVVKDHFAALQAGSDQADKKRVADQSGRPLNEPGAAVAFSDSNTPTTPVAAPPAPQAGTSASVTAEAPEVSARKIIRNGTVEFEVRSFDDTADTVTKITTEEKGYIASTSSDKLANGKVRGIIVVRIPPDNLDRFLLKIRALGELKTQQIGSSDVTKQYTDIESELRGLRTMETRLIDLIKTGKGEVKDLVEAEKQLGDYRIRIEKLEGEIRYYNNLVSMATLTITAYEKDIQKPTAAAEQESINVALQTEQVETQYAAARKIIEDAKGRIVESQLKNTDADHVSALISADVPPDKADFVSAQLKQLGVVANFARDRRQTTTGGPGAPPPNVQVEQKDTRISVTLFNLANLAPRETVVVNVATRDVESAYRKALALLRATDASTTQPAAAPSGRGVTRVMSSNLNGQNPDQMTADIVAEIRSDSAAGPAGANADAILQAIREAGETLTSTIAENPDKVNSTPAKRGLQVRFINVAAVPARESQSLRLVASDVPAAYNKILASLQALAAAGNARIITSSLNQSDPRTVTAALAFEVRRDSLPAFDKALADSGVDLLARNIARATNTANTLDSKVLFQVDALLSADALEPRRTITQTLEVEDVEKAVEALRSYVTASSVKEIAFDTAKESTGRVTAHLALDAPTADTGSLLTHIRDLHGIDRDNQVTRNANVPDTRFSKDRVQLTLTSRAAIVEANNGLWPTVRAALSSAAAALLYSVYLVVTGLLFVAPFALILYPLYRLARRRKSPAA